MQCQGEALAYKQRQQLFYLAAIIATVYPVAGKANVLANETQISAIQWLPSHFLVTYFLLFTAEKLI